jgi:hypothetical protein
MDSSSRVEVMTTFPTAEDIARAIVASCRETGEDAVRAASGFVGDINGPSIHARHYAMHALLHVFPDLPRLAAARVVGCPGKPASFYNNSWNQVVRPRSDGTGHMAKWWDEYAFARVIAAIERAPEPSKKFRIADSLETRRKPSAHVDDHTAALMGDPPPGRSALAQKQAEGRP